MKTILITGLMAAGVLQSIAAGPEVRPHSKRIVDVYVQEEVLVSTSDGQTGGITKVEVLNESNQVVLCQEYGGGYYYQTNLSALHTGYYSAKVTTTRTVYYEGVYVP